MDNKDFLRKLWGDGNKPPGQILIWTLSAVHQQKMSKWLTTPDYDPSQSKHVFTGMGTASPAARFTKFERVPADEVHALAGCWADIDVAGPGHKGKDYPPDEEAAWEVIRSILPPTMVVSSGGGLHGYWLFEVPWILDVETRPVAAQLVKDWQAALRVFCMTRGWDLDATHDLARVMRLPGSMNVKDADNPQPVNIIYSGGPRYALETLQAALDKPPPAFSAALSLGHGRQLDRERRDQFFEAIPQARDAFSHRSRLRDPSLSGYDLSLANFAVQAGFSDEEIAALLIEHRTLHGKAEDIEKCERTDYLRRTITTARAKGGGPDASNASSVFEVLQGSAVRRAAPLARAGKPPPARVRVVTGPGKATHTGQRRRKHPKSKALRHGLV